MSLAKPDNPEKPQGHPLAGRGKKHGWIGAATAFFVERLGLDSAAALAAHKRVPVHNREIFYFLGGMALFLFGIQVITGILLSLYYKPSPDQAFESVRAIVTEVDFGWLIRSIHSWSANLLIGVLFLHVLTTYIMRAYRPPREFTWLTGIALLGVFMTFGFSGYLLPWNKLAFFATNVGTAIAENVPVIGHYLLLMARGGENVTGDTLARFYALHVVILPLTALGIVGLHLYLVQKHEISVPLDVIEKYGSAEEGAEHALRAALPAAGHGGLVHRLGDSCGLGGPLPLGTGAEGRSLRLGPGKHQAGMVLPLHVPGLEGPASVPSQREPQMDRRGNIGHPLLRLPGIDGGVGAVLGPRGRRRTAAAGAEFLCRLDGGVRRFHDRAEHDDKGPAESARQDPVGRRRRGNPRGGNAMKKLLFLLTPALLLVVAVFARSAEDKKDAAPAAKAQAEDAKSASGKPAETEPAGIKPAGAKVPEAVIEIKSVLDDEKENACIKCHTDPDAWDSKDPTMYKNYIPPNVLEALKKELHWQKGVRCHDCHGGDPSMLDDVKAHLGKGEFRGAKPADIPDLCGRCHSDIEYMRHFNPSPRTDQLAEYWTSGHGKQLKKGDMQVATCISCHDRPHGDAVDPKPHGIRPVREPASPVYRTKVAETCAKCHSDKALMRAYSITMGSRCSATNMTTGRRASTAWPC